MVFIIHFIIGHEQTSAVFALAAIANRCGDALFSHASALSDWAALEPCVNLFPYGDGGDVSRRAVISLLRTNLPTFSGLQARRRIWAERIFWN